MTREKEAPIGWGIAVLAVFTIFGLAVLAAIGFGLYFLTDLACVAWDEGSASAICQTVR